MALLSSSPFSSILIILCIFSSIFLTLVTAKVDGGYAQSFDPEELGMKKEKFSHFRFYWHDIVSGSNPTSVTVVHPPSNSSTFGQINMIDNPLTEGPNLTSKLIGKAQGFYGSASQEGIGLIMVMNFAFMEGKYNGSTITVLGRNMIFTKIREMAVIGGTGVLRFARGYAQASTYYANFTTRDAIVEYNCYVVHY
ncbi:Dirigent protein [Dillenia turbinata]|uniref:Dirigent protein n=1 Tax=Dillenia turbinata TaxID=194707 RepID=A0AAN8VMW2_9MAGN